MYPFHVFISIVNIIFGLAFFLDLIFPEIESTSKYLLIGVWASSLFAIFTTFVIFILFAIRCITGGVKLLLKNHWLGMFNGFFVMVFWTLSLLFFLS